MRVSVKVAPGASLGKAQPAITKDESTKEPDEWETKGHMNDLIRAHEIINDPVKMQAVHKMVGRHQKAIGSIQDLKNLHQQKYGPKAPKPGVAQLQDNDNDAEDDEGSSY